jgi:mannose-6-phosphate isomerase-like protein (cupin superfamily)
MTDNQKYIESGLLEDYCLGLLSATQSAEVSAACASNAALQAELEKLQRSLEQYAETQAVTPRPALKQDIMALLGNLQKETTFTEGNLPLLNQFSDSRQWLDYIRPMTPAAFSGETVMLPLREDDTVIQMAVWTDINIPDEEHDDLQESFIILEGECECFVGDKVYRLKAGDYLEIPLHEHHDVKLLSAKVVAILQRVKVA